MVVHYNSVRSKEQIWNSCKRNLDKVDLQMMFQSADMSLEENLGQFLGFQRVHGRKLNLDKSL